MFRSDVFVCILWVEVTYFGTQIYKKSIYRPKLWKLVTMLNLKASFPAYISDLWVSGFKSERTKSTFIWAMEFMIGCGILVRTYTASLTLENLKKACRKNCNCLLDGGTITGWGYETMLRLLSVYWSACDEVETLSYEMSFWKICCTSRNVFVDSVMIARGCGA